MVLEQQARTVANRRGPLFQEFPECAGRDPGDGEPDRGGAASIWGEGSFPTGEFPWASVLL